ncbi:MAG: hypothetical protein AAFP02_08595 [Bacteroidota bacterium]
MLTRIFFGFKGSSRMIDWFLEKGDNLYAIWTINSTDMLMVF